MAKENQLARYGAIAKAIPFSAGKTFFLLTTTEAMMARFLELYPNDADGVPRIYSDYASAITAIQGEADSGVGCALYVSVNFTTAPTAAQLTSLNAAKVSVFQMGVKNEDGTYFSTKAAYSLATATTTSLFQVNGKIEVIEIVSEVVTTPGTTASSGYTFQIFPGTSTTAAVFAATTNIQGQPAGATFNITGTLANALVVTSTQGVFVRQAAPLVVSSGTISSNVTATTGGFVKTRLRYKPLEPGAFVSPL